MENSNIKVFVDDTGCGINPLNIQNLGKLKTFNDKKGSTVGFGLFISKTLVNFISPKEKSLNGLFVKSELNKGSTFGFYLDDRKPYLSSQEFIASESQSPSIEKFNHSHYLKVNMSVLLNKNFSPSDNNNYRSSFTGAHSNSSLKKKKCFCPKIMVVDDAPFNIEIIKKFFENKSILCESASNGKIAIEKIKKIYLEREANFCKICGFFKCILMDIQMPEMDGIETSKELKKFFREKSLNTVIIGVSAFSDEQIKTKAKEAGMIEYHEKPISKKVIQEIIFKYLNN